MSVILAKGIIFARHKRKCPILEKNIGFLLCCCCCFSLSLLAQKESKNQVYLPENKYFKQVYNNNSDLSYFCPLGELGAPYSYIFSSEINPNFFIAENKKKPYALCITPSILIRMHSNSNPGDRSFAVRTPSYRVKARGFYALATTKKNYYHYLEGQYVHHSNGQDGLVLQPNGQINTSTGSFSTNYTYLSYHASQIDWLRQTDWSIGLEWHPWFVYHDAALIKNYGFTRIHYDASYIKSNSYTETEKGKTIQTKAEQWRVQWKSNYAINQIQTYTLGAWKRRLNAELIISYLPSSESSAGIYLATGYYGEDPYNIFFLDHYAFVRVGFCIVPFTRQ
jgi:hypothetical protein